MKYWPIQKKSRNGKSKLKRIVQTTMPFNSELIKVSNVSGKYMNLVHGTATITFKFQDCYSHFGVSNQFDDEMLDEQAALVSGIITVTAIYTGCEHPSILVRVDKIDIRKAPPREAAEALSDDNEPREKTNKVTGKSDDNCTNDFCDWKGWECNASGNK